MDAKYYGTFLPCICKYYKIFTIICYYMTTEYIYYLRRRYIFIRILLDKIWEAAHIVSHVG